MPQLMPSGGWKVSKRMASEQSTSFSEREVVEHEYHDLPEGITLRSLRTHYLVPESAQLVVMFVRSSNKPITATITDGQSAQEERYQWRCNTEYLVVPNGNKTPFVYLTPVSAADGSEHQTDMPFKVDDQLATAAVRQQLDGLEIKVKSHGCNLRNTIQGLQEQLLSEGLAAKFKHEMSSFGARDYCEKVLQTHVFEAELGSRAPEWLEFMCSILAEEAFYESAENDKQVSVVEVFKHTVDTFVSFILEKIQLHLAETQVHDVAFYFDQFSHGDDKTAIPISTVMTRIKNRGWSFSIPYGDCPQQINSLLVSYFDGSDLEKGFPKFSESLQRWIAQGKIAISLKDRSLGVAAAALDPVPYRAVFHGDDTIDNGLETLRIMGDPIMGSTTFNRHIYRFIDRGDTLLDNTDVIEEPLIIRITPKN